MVESQKNNNNNDYISFHIDSKNKIELNNTVYCPALCNIDQI